MKPIRTLKPLSVWLMRLAVLLFVFLAYYDTLTMFNMGSVMFYVSLIFLLFTILLFIGGFLKSGKLTVVSALILILVTGYQSFLVLKSGLDYNFALYVVLGSIFVYFLAHGNSRY